MEKAIFIYSYVLEVDIDIGYRERTKEVENIY